MDTAPALAHEAAPAANGRPAAPAPPPAPAAPRGGRASPALLAALALLAGAGALGLGAVPALSAWLAQGEAQESSPSPEAVVLRLLAKPSTERIPLAGSKGTLALAVGSGGRAALLLRGFPAAADGWEHQAWVLARGARPVLGAVFRGSERAVLLRSLVPPGASVAVVTAPAGRPVPPRGAPGPVARRPPG